MKGMQKSAISTINTAVMAGNIYLLKVEFSISMSGIAAPTADSRDTAAQAAKVSGLNMSTAVHTPQARCVFPVMG